VSGLLKQLHIDQSLFVQLAIFTLLFLILSQIYFKPFLNLIQRRHEKTVEDRIKAERLAKEANEKIQLYRARLQEERKKFRADYENLVLESRQKEQEIISEARTKAKLITETSLKEARAQKERLKQELQSEVQGMAKNIADNLLLRK